jgi:hypothetical protein
MLRRGEEERWRRGRRGRGVGVYSRIVVLSLEGGVCFGVVMKYGRIRG